MVIVAVLLVLQVRLSCLLWGAKVADAERRGEKSDYRDRPKSAEAAARDSGRG